jgi:hypothetical protein
MDELMIAEPVIVGALPTAEPPKQKRLSGYDRMRRKNTYLQGNVADLASDVAALESLVATLLSHLQVAIRPDLGEEDRNRIRRVLNGIRAALASDDTGGPTS